MDGWTKKKEKRILEAMALNETKRSESSNQLGGFTEPVNHELEADTPEFLPQGDIFTDPPIEMLYCMKSTK